MSLKEDINYSLWCDFIERDFLENGFKNLIENKIINGATSNPSIFASSISSSSAYKQQLDMLQANDAKTIYEELALTDIKRASQLLLNLHKENLDDGFISIEVDPTLCNDAEKTIKEGERIFSMLAAENIMIKIPATEAGYIAMRELTSKGINVNATLIFSPKQAAMCAKALDDGIKASNKDTKAVVSVFVSRFDRKLDNILVEKSLETGKIGIVNATKCYYEVNSIENKNVRTLFASTGVKDDKVSSCYYVDNLIFPNSINTAPLSTIKDWVNDGIKEETKIKTEKECDDYFKLLENNDINLERVYEKLLEEGLEAFKISFKELLSKIMS